MEGFYEVGETFRGTRTIVRVKGGWFEGPKAQGRDPARARATGSSCGPGGVAEGDVRDTYRTHDGHIIYVSYRGIIEHPRRRSGSGSAGARTCPYTEYYLRMQPMFETAVDSPYSWLNNILAVSVGKQEALGITYDVYQIL